MFPPCLPFPSISPPTPANPPGPSRPPQGLPPAPRDPATGAPGARSPTQPRGPGGGQERRTTPPGEGNGGRGIRQRPGATLRSRHQPPAARGCRRISDTIEKVHLTDADAAFILGKAGPVGCCWEGGVAPQSRKGAPMVHGTGRVFWFCFSKIFPWCFLLFEVANRSQMYCFPI